MSLIVARAPKTSSSSVPPFSSIADPTSLTSLHPSKPLYLLSAPVLT
jgi:hypothetical protein